jgi:hypothetical protein
MSNHVPKMTTKVRCRSVEICCRIKIIQRKSKVEVPSRFARWIVAMSVPSADREEILYLMHERFFRISETSGGSAAKRWYAAEAMIFLVYWCHRQGSHWVDRCLKPFGLLVD